MYSKIFPFLVTLALCFAGCATKVGKTSFPEAAAGFVPKRTYAVPYATAWEKVQLTLDNARIVIASANKTDSSGRIQTDYIAGPRVLILGGFAGSQACRYRYSITVRPDGDKTNVGVVCKIESTTDSGNGSSQWTDVSGQNEKLILNLGNWLYEQIEKNL